MKLEPLYRTVEDARDFKWQRKLSLLESWTPISNTRNNYVEKSGKGKIKLDTDCRNNY